MITTVSTEFKSKEELREFIEYNNLEYKSEVLCQVFCAKGDKFYFEYILKAIKHLLPEAKILGSTSPFNIYNGKTCELSTILVFTCFEKSKVEVGIARKDKDVSEFELGKNLASHLLKDNTKVFILFCTTPFVDCRQIVRGIESVKESVLIVGGNAASLDMGNYLNTAVCANCDIGIDESIAVASISGDELIANCEMMFNWLKVGRSYKITKADGNRILEIDGTYISHPVHVVDDSGAILIAENIESGTLVKLAYGNRYHIFKGAEKHLSNIINLPVETAIIYSCIGRLDLLKEEIDFEISPLTGQLSVNGFYACGEYGRINGRNNYLKNTSSILLLSENKFSRIKVEINALEKLLISTSEEEVILHRFLQKAVDDLQNFNERLERKVEEKTHEILYQANYNKDTGLKNQLSLDRYLAENKINKIAYFDCKFIDDLKKFYGNDFSINLQKNIAGFFRKSSAIMGGILFQIDQRRFIIASNDLLEENLFKRCIISLQQDLHTKVFKILGVRVHCYTKLGIAMNTDLLDVKAQLAL